MITDRKQAKADLRRSYNVYLQLGLIVALLSFIGLVRINLYSEPPSPPPVEEQEEVVMEEVIQTKQIETPPPPPRPPVPVEVPNDEIIEDKGVKLFVDPGAIMYLLGTEMDYKKEELSSSFIFKNPNETERCGCGESFKI